jgi:oxygen-independent coproporphyrinogen-3 oxidase
MIDEADLAGGPERRAQSEAAAERLVGYGYRRIGLDHFAAEGDALTAAHDNGELRRNFQGYTTDRAASLIGFGASAIGALADGYLQNAVPIGQYSGDISGGRLAVRRGIALTADDRVRRDVIEKLMCRLEVDLSGLGEGCFADELSRLAPMAADGLVEIDDGHIRVTEAGRPLLRSVCAVFDRYLGSGPGRYSRAV